MNKNIARSLILQLALMLPSACGGAVGDPPATNTPSGVVEECCQPFDAATGDAALPTPACTGPFYDETRAPPVAVYKCPERTGSNCTYDPQGGYLCLGTP